MEYIKLLKNSGVDIPADIKERAESEAV